MSYMEICAGNKEAKVLAARFIKSPKKGTLGIEIKFEFQEPGYETFENLNWVGWLSPAAIENTMDTLVHVLGFNGDDSCDENGFLTNPNAFDKDKKVQIVVELEEYMGKHYPKIKWVNRPGGSGFEGLKPNLVKTELEGCGFKAAFLAASQIKSQVETPF